MLYYEQASGAFKFADAPSTGSVLVDSTLPTQAFVPTSPELVLAIQTFLQVEDLSEVGFYFID